MDKHFRQWIVAFLFLVIFNPQVFAQKHPGDVVIHMPELSSTSKGGTQVNFYSDNDGIFQFQLAGNYDREVGGNFNLVPRTALMEAFYQVSEDDYDFVMVFTDFEFNTGMGTRAYFVLAHNDIEGIGIPLVDNRALLGGSETLQGFIEMAALSRYDFDNLAPAYDTLLDTAMHELMHRWSAKIAFRDVQGFASDALIGAEDAHWGEFVDSGASVMGGALWQQQGNLFTAIDRINSFHDFDLYLAGLISPESTSDISYIQGPAGDPGAYWPEIGDTVNGIRMPVSVNDVITVEGPRVPSHDNAQKQFHVAMLVLTRPGLAINPVQLGNLKSFKTALERRFHVATKGNGSLYFAPRNPLPEAGEPDTIYAEGANLADIDYQRAANWLEAKLTVEGYWEDSSGTAVRDTAMMLRAGALVDELSAQVLTDANSWLANQVGSDFDSLVWRNMRTGQLDENIMAFMTNEEGVSLLTDDTALPASVYDSALALHIADGCDSSGSLHPVRDYLITQQLESGAWPLHKGGVASLEVTARAVLALKNCEAPESVINSGQQWLQQQVDASAGFEAVHHNALAAFALSYLGEDSAASVNLLTNRIRQSQMTNGSWSNSVYATAHAILALKSLQKSNLKFDTPLIAPNSEAVLGEYLELQARIKNEGVVNALPSVATLSITQPGSPDTILYSENIDIPEIAGSAFYDFQMYLDTMGFPEQVIVSLVIDADDQLDEYLESDNRSDLSVELQSASGPDLSLAYQDFTVLPEVVPVYPTNVEISGVVRNIGDADATASDVSIQFRTFSGEIVTLWTQSVQVPAQGSIDIHANVELQDPSYLQLFISVDRDQSIVEADEDNNEIILNLMSADSLDIVVDSAEFITSQPPFLASESISLAVSIQNTGTIASPPFAMELNAQTPDGQQVISTEQISLQPGQVIIREYEYTPQLSGNYEFTFLADSEDAVFESNEQNNALFANINVSGTDKPNLVIQASNISIHPDPALQAQALDVEILVSNTGDVDAANFDVAVFDGNPEDGGLEIGRTTLPELVARSDQIVGIQTDPVQGHYERNVFVFLDVDQAIDEISETDNIRFAEIEVESLPDLEINTASLVLTPSVPVPGDPLQVSILVRNLGEQTSANTTVMVQELIDDQTVTNPIILNLEPIAGRSESTVAHQWRLSDDAVNGLKVQVDHTDSILELSDVNNEIVIDLEAGDRRFYVTDALFSPNGDGVKDVTTIVVNAGQPGTYNIQVENAFGETIKTFAPLVVVDSNPALLTWDGRTDFGQVARDGQYVIKTFLGVEPFDLSVEIDTNKNPVWEAYLTQNAYFTEIGCYADQFRNSQLSQDGRYLVANSFTKLGATQGQNAIYRMPVRGGIPERISPYFSDDSVFGADEYSGATLHLMDDGSILMLRGDVLWLQKQAFGDIEEIYTPFGINTVISMGGDKVLVDYFDNGIGENVLAIVDVEASASPISLVPRISHNSNFYRVKHGWVELAYFNGTIANAIVRFLPDDSSGDFQEFPLVTNGGSPTDIYEMDFAMDPSKQLLAVSSFSNTYYHPRNWSLQVLSIGGRRAELLWETNETLEPFQKREIHATGDTGVVVTKMRELTIEKYDLTGNNLWTTNIDDALFQEYADTNQLSGFSYGINKFRPVRGTGADSGIEKSALLDDAVTNSFFEIYMSREYAGGYRAASQTKANGLQIFGQLYNLDLKTGSLTTMGTFNRTNDDDVVFPRELEFNFQLSPDLTRISAIRGGDYWVFNRFGNGGPLFMANHRAMSAEELPIRESALLDSYPRATFTVPTKLIVLGMPDWTYSVCDRNNDLNSTIVENTDNLIADLRADIYENYVDLIVTATDKNFDRFILEWKSEDSSEGWTQIGQIQYFPISRTLVNAWTPPEPGDYTVRLTVYDKAGNRDRDARSLTWNTRSSVVDVELSDVYFSPNGDGVKDQTHLSFLALEPFNTTLDIYDANDLLVTSIDVNVNEVTGLQELYTWDGTDASGSSVPDGAYKLRFLGREYRLYVDTVAPTLSAFRDPLDQGGGNVMPPAGEAFVAEDDCFHYIYRSLSMNVFDQNQTSLLINIDGREFTSGLADFNQDPVVVTDVCKNTNYQDTPERTIPLEVRDFSNATISVVAQDLAGNRSLDVAEKGNEVTVWGSVHAEESRLVYTPFFLNDRVQYLSEGVLPFAVSSSVSSQSGSPTVHVATYLDGEYLGETPLNREDYGALFPHDFSYEIPDIQPMEWSVFAFELVYKNQGQEITRSNRISVFNQDIIVRIFKYGDFSESHFPVENFAFHQSELDSTLAAMGIDSREVFVAVENHPSALIESEVFIDFPDVAGGITRYLDPFFVYDFNDGRSTAYLYRKVEWEYCNYAEQYVWRYQFLGQEVSRRTNLKYPLTLPCTAGENTLSVSSGEICENIERETIFHTFETPNQPLLDLDYFEVELVSGEDTLLVANGTHGSTNEIPFDSGASYTTRAYWEGNLETTYPFTIPEEMNAELLWEYPAQNALVCAEMRSTPFEQRLVLPFEYSVKGVVNSWLSRKEAFEYFPIELSVSDGSSCLDGPIPTEERLVAFSQCDYEFERVEGDWILKEYFLLSDTYQIHIGDGPDQSFSGPVSLTSSYVGIRSNNACQTFDFRVDGSVDFELLGSGSGLDVNDPFLLSPNNDGIDDSVSFGIRAHEPLELGYFVFPYDSYEQAIDQSPASVAISGMHEFIWEPGSLEDGLYVIVLRFEDSCGLVEHQRVWIEIDNTPPVLQIETPNALSYDNAFIDITGVYKERNPEVFEVFVQYQGGEEYLLLSDQEGAFPAHTANIQFITTWETAEFDTGDYELILRATDAVGNASEVRHDLLLESPDSIVWALGVNPRLISPNADDVLDYAAISIATHEVSTLISLDVLGSDGNALRSLTEEQHHDPGNFETVWDGTNDFGMVVPDGFYDLMATLENLPGESTFIQVESARVQVDSTQPLIVTNLESDNYVSDGADLVVTITEANPLSYSVVLLDSALAPVSTVVDQDLFESNVDLHLEDFLSGMPDQRFIVQITANDRAGNTSQQNIDITLDTTTPEAAILSPTVDQVVGGVETEIDFSGTATDMNLESYTLRLRPEGADNNDPWHNIIVGHSSVESDVLGTWAIDLPDGLYDLELVVVDKAGNTSKAQQRMILDTTPPLVEIDAPLSGALVGPGIDVEGSVQDDNLLHYQFYTAPANSDDWVVIHQHDAPVLDDVLMNWQAVPRDGPVQLKLVARDVVDLTSETIITLEMDATNPPPPLTLTATKQGLNDVQLQWSASQADDVVAYQIYRNSNAIVDPAIPQTQYLDTDLPEALYTYWVVAIDHVGNVSAPSNEVAVDIDLSPPEAILMSPADESFVSGEIEVVGTAQSVGDFDGYRVYLWPENNPDAITLLTESPQSIVGGQMAQINTHILADGVRHVVMLEAQDTSGNIVQDQHVFTVDNTAPAPLVLTVTPEGDNDAQLDWNASSAPDIAGYALYRDDVLIDALGEPVTTIQAALLSDTTFLDVDLSDGQHRWRVHAVDMAGNISEPSNEVNLTISARPPQATIVTPEPGQKFEAPLYILATSPDTDIAEVAFEARELGQSWISLGVDSQRPYETTLDASALGFAFGDIELRAIATDTTLLADPAPNSIVVEYADLTAPQPAIDLTALTQGADVTLNWTPSPSSEPLSYTILRKTDAPNAEFTAITSGLNTTTTIDSGLADGTYHYQVIAVDNAENASEPSNTVQAVVHTLKFEHPYTPISAATFNLAGTAQIAGDVSLQGPAILQAQMTQGQNNGFAFQDVPISNGEHTFQFYLTDASQNTSRVAQVVMQKGPVPEPPQNVVANVDAGGTVSVSWDSPGNTPIQGYRVFRNDLARDADVTINNHVSVQASSNPGQVDNAVDGSSFSYWYPYDSGLYSEQPQWLSLALANKELIHGAGNRMGLWHGVRAYRLACSGLEWTCLDYIG